MPTAWLKCPECSTLQPLDDAGRFAVHSLPIEACKPGCRGWCPTSGQKPGRIVVDGGAKDERKER